MIVKLKPEAYLVPELIDLYGTRHNVPPDMVDSLHGSVAWHPKYLFDDTYAGVEDKDGVTHYPKALYTSEALHAEPRGAVKPSHVGIICNRYESGFGHGLANDGLDLSKTPHADPAHAEAYQLGYLAGQEVYASLGSPTEVTDQPERKDER